MTEVTRFPEANKAYAAARQSIMASSIMASSSKASQAESRTREP